MQMLTYPDGTPASIRLTYFQEALAKIRTEHWNLETLAAAIKAGSVDSSFSRYWTGAGYATESNEQKILEKVIEAATIIRCRDFFWTPVFFILTAFLAFGVHALDGTDTISITISMWPIITIGILGAVIGNIAHRLTVTQINDNIVTSRQYLKCVNIMMAAGEDEWDHTAAPFDATVILTSASAPELAKKIGAGAQQVRQALLAEPFLRMGGVRAEAVQLMNDMYEVEHMFYKSRR